MMKTVLMRVSGIFAAAVPLSMLAGCTSAWVPEYMPALIMQDAPNAVPRSGTFVMANLDDMASLDEFDAAMAVAIQLQPNMDMVTAPTPSQYRVTTSFARQPASVKILVNEKNIVGNIPPRAPFGCRRDIIILDVIITRANDGALAYAGRARQIVCQGVGFDPDRAALAKSALQIPLKVVP